MSVQTIMCLLNRLFRDDDGAAASEYAIVVAFIATAIALAVAQFNLGNLFEVVVAKVQALIV